MNGNGLPLGLQSQITPQGQCCDCMKLLACIFFKAVLYEILIFDIISVIFIQQKIVWLSVIMAARLTAVMGLLPTAVHIMPTLGMSFREYICTLKKKVCCVHEVSVNLLWQNYVLAIN